MVVTQNQVTAFTLCKVWREWESIKNVYLSHVRHWPPYHKHQLKEGTIDIPLARSRTERIKWEFLPVAEGGKEYKTYWKVYEDFDKLSGKDEEGAAQNSQVIKKGTYNFGELHRITDEA